MTDPTRPNSEPYGVSPTRRGAFYRIGPGAQIALGIVVLAMAVGVGLGAALGSSAETSARVTMAVAAPIVFVLGTYCIRVGRARTKWQQHRR